MTILVDTSVWPLAFRRDAPDSGPEVLALRASIDGGDAIVTTRLVLQELLQGFTGPRARKQLVRRFAALPLLVPDRRDHLDAADVRNVCRRAGVQIGTIDALLCQLCIRHELILLATDHDFTLAARHCPFRMWNPASLGAWIVLLSGSTHDRRESASGNTDSTATPLPSRYPCPGVA